MYVKHLLRLPPQRLYNLGSHAQVWHKASIHDVNVEDLRLPHPFQLRSQGGEIRRQQRGRHISHDDPVLSQIFLILIVHDAQLFFNEKPRPGCYKFPGLETAFLGIPPRGRKTGASKRLRSPLSCAVFLFAHYIYYYNRNGVRQASSWQAAWARIVISGMVKMESTVLTATVLEARAESRLYCTANSTVLAATGQAA